MSVHTLSEIYNWLLYVCTIGQIFFVIVWSTVKWWETRVGRALFVKSLSIAVALCAVSFFNITHYHVTIVTFYKVYIAAFFLMFIGISYQDLAMFLELRDRNNSRKNKTQ